MPVALGVYVVVHVAVAPEPLPSVHAGLNVPFAAENVTVALGVIGVPVSVSVTVAVHVVPTPTSTDVGVHENDVDVVRLTLTVVAPLLTACVLSPP